MQQRSNLVWTPDVLLRSNSDDDDDDNDSFFLWGLHAVSSRGINISYWEKKYQAASMCKLIVFILSWLLIIFHVWSAALDLVQMRNSGIHMEDYILSLQLVLANWLTCSTIFWYRLITRLLNLIIAIDSNDLWDHWTLEPNDVLTVIFQAAPQLKLKSNAILPVNNRIYYISK